jgi:unsaturated rhamnogalacturonyl hydrolase
MKNTITSFLIFAGFVAFSQKNITNANDSNTPLHLLQPDYPVPYGIPKAGEVKQKLDQVFNYLNNVTPYELENAKTGEKITDFAKIDANTSIKKGDFRLVSYEWGVTYAALYRAFATTGDEKYKDYADNRLNFINDAAKAFSKLKLENSDDWAAKGPLKNLLIPKALDDCGAMAAAIIKAKRAGNPADFKALIDIHIDYILHQEHRLADGTLSRIRPQNKTIWLDDLFMAVPALAQMGKLTGEKKYYDEACKQVLSFAKRMFNKNKNVFMHGWVEGMRSHPQFHWARANGWAILTMVELLDVLPKNHPERQKILALLQLHAAGLASYQSGAGFWHQLLDKPDSYLETSATAIYTYSFAKAINNGWLDKLAYTPATLLGWNAIATKVNEKGQVEGTCVGTGMAFDPAFYYHRPISPFAAHGYGPFIYAAAEIIALLNHNKFEINDSAVQLLLDK